MRTADRPASVELHDRVAFRAFYEEAMPIVYSFIYHRVGGRRSVAEDLTQETFEAAVREIRSQTRVDAPVPWVMGIARHKLLDHYRREERDERRLRLAYAAEAVRSEHPLDPAATSATETFEALAQIPASQRAALILRHMDGLSVGDVAQALGRSVRATESLLARGRISFRRALRGVDHG